jgi:hypothetical protein
MQEQIRNRLLRRADWRFLLSNPRPTKSVCFANGRLSRAVGLISAAMTDPRLESTEDCDLAVAVNPNRATLRKCWTSLRAGGSCYIEWYSPFAGGPKGVQRRLEAAGFENITCYWPWPMPSFYSPRYWLPLGESGALHHFLLSRPPIRGIIRRVANVGLRALWRASLRFRLTLPICAVAHKPPLSEQCRSPSVNFKSSATSPMQGASGTGLRLLEMIRGQWEVWGFGATPDHLSALVLTGGHRSVGKIVWLVFGEPNHSPRLAVKMPRVPESVPGLIREATALQSVQALRPGGVQGAPRVLFCHEHAGLFTVGETAITGQLILALLRPDNYRDFALKAADWLADLAGRPAPCPPATWWNRLIEPVLTDFGESFGSVVDPGMLRETQDILRTLGALPLVCEQRDFGPWNVLMTAGGELAVLDWESSEPHGLPALDLIYFLSFLALSLDGPLNPERIRASYPKILSSSTLTSGVLRECLERYARKTGLDFANLRPLRLLCWLLHSRSEYQWFTADFARKPEREALRRSLFVSLWEQELLCGAKS